MDPMAGPLGLALDASIDAFEEEDALRMECKRLETKIRLLTNETHVYFWNNDMEAFENLARDCDDTRAQYEEVYVRYILKVEEAMILRKKVVNEETALGRIHSVNAERMQFVMSSRRMKARKIFWQQYIDKEDAEGRVTYMDWGISGHLTPEVRGLYEDHGDKGNDDPPQWQETVEAYCGRPSSNNDVWTETLCQISGQNILNIEVAAVAIVPMALDSPGMAKLLFQTDDPAIGWGRNGLLMHAKIKAWYKDHRLVVVPFSNDNVTRWRIDVISNKIMDEEFETANGKVIRGRDLDGKELTFATGQRPAARNLCFRFIMSLLTIRDLNRPGWENVWAHYLQVKPFPGFPNVDNGYVSRAVLQALGSYFAVADTPLMQHWMLDYSFYGHLLEKEQPSEMARRIHRAAFLECDPLFFRDLACDIMQSVFFLPHDLSN